MKYAILFGLMLLMSIAVYGYTDGQTISQSAIDNYDTTVGFSTVYSDFECQIMENADRHISEDGMIYYKWVVGCWNIRLEEGEYTLRWKNHSEILFLQKYKQGLRRECGYPADLECKDQFTDTLLDKLKKTLKRRIMVILAKIDRWKTEDEPEDLEIQF